MFNTNKLRVWATKAGVLRMFHYLHTQHYFKEMNKRYQRYKETGEIPIPERFIFDLTFKCNLHCKMCYINFPSMWKKKTIEGTMELTTEQIKKVFDKIPKITHITLIGGEIFARQDIFEILDYFQGREALVRLSTNLTMLNDEKIEKLKTYKNIEAIGTSIDGDREIHNDIRDPKQRKAFDQTIDTIKKLKDHFFVGVLSVVLDDNLEDLPKVVRIAKDAGAHIVTFEYERRYTQESIQQSADYLGFKPEDFPLMQVEQLLPRRPHEDFQKAVERVVKMGEELSMPIGFLPLLFKENLERYFYRNLDTEHFCKQLFIGRVDAQGNVVHCFAIRKPFGNLLLQSYEEIWNSPAYKAFRQKMDGVILPVCATCEKLVECRGGEQIKAFGEINNGVMNGNLVNGGQKKNMEFAEPLQIIPPRPGRVHNLPE